MYWCAKFAASEQLKNNMLIQAQAAEHFEMEESAMPLLNCYLRKLLVHYTGAWFPSRHWHFCSRSLTVPCNLLFLRLYFHAESSPTAATILALLEGLETPGSPLVFDHIAFRTYGVRHCMLQSLVSRLQLPCQGLTGPRNWQVEGQVAHPHTMHLILSSFLIGNQSI